MSDFRDHIAVIDYGMGNLHSVAKALEHVAPSALVSVTSDPQVVENADRVVFPGVGAIRDCMHEIQRLNIGEVVKKAIQTKPVLAICVGMQALMESSEENSGINCLNIMPGQVKYFGDNLVDSHGNKLKVPHMGWNNVNQSQDHALWHNIDQDSRFYFVHSYYVEAENNPNVFATCDYGKQFAASVQQGNLFAVQFHPEKSADAGLQLLSNFCQWQGA
ncbi:imidazole glycerol phosphate synthase subunit HisH [Porticoccaceae bacterium]|jgi:imidazole glycerol-phosphate synthase subunit HisH|nr:imidazole glycerol phosphate synthase subunit HisH [Porticoccaceae bacterium]MDA9570146.1 imidazole glycerol phosphate synthase subunit HisH [Porticoccaceae bacterium]